MFGAADVAEVRHVVQRILVPCVFVIGLLGNAVSIYVLTRKRMRCTTNIYLTALAITDIIYLTMALLLSLQHYEYVQRFCQFYWMHYGIMVWLCDACAYISIYIAVCFTIERFIAIRYPLKRQTFCTESLAKRVIAGVALFCLLSTISTAFEHEYRLDTRLIDDSGRHCNLTTTNASQTTMSTLSSKSGPQVNYEAEWQSSEDESSPPLVELYGTALPRGIAPELIALSNTDALLNVHLIKRASRESTRKLELELSLAIGEELNPGQDGDQKLPLVSFVLNTTEYCRNVTYYQNSSSNLGRDPLYMRICYYYTTFVFVLIPVCVLSTFNCFLIMLVRRSKNLRGEMTNASSIRRPKRKSHISSVSQENRVTVTLIAVVLLFIVCQLPWAIYLIVLEHKDIDTNLQAIFGNIFNFLAATNAAANFFLYCVLSDKYRKTVRELITGYKYHVQRHAQTNASLYTNSNTALNGCRRHRQTSGSISVR